MFHPWSKFKYLAKTLPNATINVFSKKPWKVEYSYDTYEACSREVTLPLVKFLSGIDPLKA